ncbi:MAG: hypothetical protein BGO29_08130 [Bacteroidales bacterium 36-12]|nr:MAG: hypothetical protein BGO29_08130 [Bacteroidales bacterium 36-12]
MKFVVLSDNNVSDDNLGSEHGLSIYLEHKGFTYLFDTGASDLFIKNAKTLNINLSNVDFVFISHAHSDHIGGLKSFLKINKKAKVVLSKYALNRQLYSKRNGLREIGNSIDYQSYKERMLLVEDKPLIGESFIASHIECDEYPKPKGNSNLFQNSYNELKPDNFNHEIVVSVGEDKQIVYTGCAHHGLLNMLETARKHTSEKISLVIGGFHLIDGEDYETHDDIKIIAEFLQHNYSNINIFSGHCTGKNAKEIFENKLKSWFKSFYVGFKFTNDL